MEKINFKNLPSTETALSANNLNKMQENIEKAILDTYSTEEQVIGTWLNAKPLYRKTVTGTTAADNNSTYIDFSNTIIRNINGYLMRGDGYRMFAPYNENNNSYIVFLQMPDGRLRIIAADSGGTGLRGVDYVITVEYTKSTD